MTKKLRRICRFCCKSIFHWGVYLVEILLRLQV